MKNKLLFSNLLLVFFLLEMSFSTIAQTVSTFDDLQLSEESYWDGSDLSGGFESGNAKFYNDYNQAWFSGTGFYYSNTTDNTTAGYVNQYSAITGSGYNASSNYAVAYDGPIGIKLSGSDAGKKVNGFFVTNTTYAYLSMKNGDQYAKQFGGNGTAVDDPDWFKLTITGYLNESPSATTVEFYLADYRFADNARDYIVNTWKWVDLNPLGEVDSLAFSLSSSDMSGPYINTPAYFAMDNFNDPLFAPAAGIDGSTAIYKSDAAFVAWATNCLLARGPEDISAIGGPLASFGTEANATGAATGSSLVSLGDGGTATLTFEYPIKDDVGADFAVFENGFSGGSGLGFLELAFVEVSSDGNRFVRFPATSLSDETVQITNADYTDARKLNNLAGKYLANYGTPFDLSELADSVGLDIDKVTHVRIVDAVGSIEPLYGSRDAHGNLVNDPWKTEFASGGFDLDAVGVIHQNTTTGIIASAKNVNPMTVYPNPAISNQQVTISLNNALSENSNVQIFDQTGKLIQEDIMSSGSFNVSTEEMLAGVYIVKVSNGHGVSTEKLIIK